MGSKDEQLAKTGREMSGQSWLPVTDPQAKAVEALTGFGQTVVEEGGQLARYIGRILGTAPHDAVGLVIGDPLHFVRTAIARQYDVLLNKIIERRNVKETQPVSPSVAIPLLRAAYDESRAELQQIWAELIAAAMDPNRSGQFRLSFIDTVKRFDPLDALVLKARYDLQGDLTPNTRDFLAKKLSRSPDEIEVSVQNLLLLKCASGDTNFYVTTYGRELVRVCSG